MIGSLFIPRNNLRPGLAVGRRGTIARGLVGLLALLGCLDVGRAGAQPVVRWTTNFYTVTGSTPREIRQSLNQHRPWKRSQEIDAHTTWSVTWKYTVISGGGGCRPETVTTEVSIVTSLPRYVPPTNAPVELRTRWARYFGALARHEAEHAAIGRAAALDVQGALSGFGERPNCDLLREALNARGAALLEQRRREEREMDQRTRHGANDGARFP
jgi:predicted secreted Zn-dependent protease